MARTNSDLVKGIIKVDDLEWEDITPFIETANELVSEVCATKVKADGVTPWHTDTRLELIERWLSAHFYAVADPRKAQESVRGVSETNQFKVDLNLAVTVYGQQAMALDTSGALKALNQTKPNMVPSVMWMGTEDE